MRLKKPLGMLEFRSSLGLPKHLPRQHVRAVLSGTENRINAARVDFNAAVETYNTSIKTVPNVFFAGIFGYKEKGFFAAEVGADKTPKVNF